MSWKDCAASIRTAAGRELTDDQVEAVFEAVQRRQDALVAQGKLDGLDARLREAAAQDAETLRIEAALAKKHAALSVIARDRATRHVERLIDQGMGKALVGNPYRDAVLALFEGTTRGVAGARNSVAATKLAYEGRFVGGMMARLVREVPHVEGLLRERPFLDDVVREMMELGEGGQPGRTGNADARKAARVMADAAEVARQDLNRLGANVGKLDGWAGPHVHDADKLVRAGKDAWVDAILPRLDLARSFPDIADEAGARRVLGNVWENIVYSPDRSPTPKPGGDYLGPRNVARALERHRVLHFKGADDWLDYAGSFGNGHIFDAMVGHQSRAALNAAQMEVLGPNPGATLDAVLSALQRRVDADDAIAPGEKMGVKQSLSADAGMAVGAAFRIASGASMMARSQTIADVAGTVRAVQSLSKLGGTVISSLTDLPVAISNLRFNGMTFGEAIGGQLDNFLQGRGKGEAREIAYLIGEGYDGMIGHIVSPYVANDGAPGAMQSLTTSFFKWTGLSWWTDANKAAVARVLSAHLGRQASLPFAELSARQRNVFRQHDITPEIWDELRERAVQKVGRRRYIVPEGEGLSRDAELALRRYFADEAQFSVIEADPTTQRYTTAGTSRGTAWGEALRFLMQFKSYPLAFTQRVGGRAVQGGEDGASAGAAHVGALVAGLLVMGYLSMSAKDAIRGYTPKEFLDDQGAPRLDTILATAFQAGGAGIYGDFLFAQVSRSGNSVLENLAGPALSDAARLVTTLQKARDGEAKAGEALNAALGSIPFANVFYARPVLDLLILNELRDTLSPGFLARRDANARRDFGQEPLIAPQDRTMGVLR